MNLIKNVDIQECTTSRIIVSSSILCEKAGNIVDMSGYEGVTFIAVFSSQSTGTTGAGKFKKGKTWLSVKASSISTGTYKNYRGLAAHTSSGFNPSANLKMLVLDIPSVGSNKCAYIKPYVHGSSSTGCSIFALKYGAKRGNSTAIMQSTHIAGSTVSNNWSTSFQSGTSAT